MGSRQNKQAKLDKQYLAQTTENRSLLVVTVIYKNAISGVITKRARILRDHPEIIKTDAQALQKDPYNFANMHFGHSCDYIKDVVNARVYHHSSNQVIVVPLFGKWVQQDISDKEYKNMPTKTCSILVTSVTYRNTINKKQNTERIVIRDMPEVIGQITNNLRKNPLEAGDMYFKKADPLRINYIDKIEVYHFGQEPVFF